MNTTFKDSITLRRCCTRELSAVYAHERRIVPADQRREGFGRSMNPNERIICIAVDWYRSNTDGCAL